MRVVVQEAAFDFAAEGARFAQSLEGAGAIVTFTGVVRDVSGGLEAMEIEHYPGMTEAALTNMTEDALQRWKLTDAMVIHRYGRLEAAEQIMMVATAAPHRRDAFEAAEFLMDYLKSRAPFWKKEITRKGKAWVAAKSDDEDALTRWK